MAGLTCALPSILPLAVSLALASGGAPYTAGPVEPAPVVGESETVQAQSDRTQRMTVPVVVDGQGPFPFLMDTGSQRTVVSNQLATTLSLRQGPDLTIISMAGTARVGSAHVEELRLGSRSLYGLHVPLLESRHMGADGIIGTDSLQDQRVLLDFLTDTIEIGDARQLGGNSGYEIVVTARRRSGQLVVTRARVDGVRISVVVDTGASLSVGNRALQKALLKRGGARGNVMLESVTGQKLTADLGVVRKLNLDDIVLTNMVIAFADTPAFKQLGLAQKPALFLGMRDLRVFERVAIDFPSRKVMFDLPPL